MKCVIFGAGGHAKIVADILRLQCHEIVGFVDNINADRKGEVFCGASVLGGDDVLDELWRAGCKDAVVAFADNRSRLQAADELLGRGFRLITAVHPSTVCGSDILIGEGSVIAAGAIIGSSSRIGRNAIVNTRASIDHDCDVSDGAHVGPGAVVAGCVWVGDRAWLGAGCVITDHKRVGADAIVGAGAVVVEDVPEKVVVVGVPAKVVRPVKF